jgi:hypothetical protein
MKFVAGRAYLYLLAAMIAIAVKATRAQLIGALRLSVASSIAFETCFYHHGLRIADRGSQSGDTETSSC